MPAMMLSGANTLMNKTDVNMVLAVPTEPIIKQLVHKYLFSTTMCLSLL